MPSDLNDFGVLVDEHQSVIRAFVAARLDDPFEAQDLAQETFLVAYRKLDEVDLSRPLRPWLLGIASNLVRNHRRKHRAVTLNQADGELHQLLEAEVESIGGRWQDAPLLDALESCLSRLGDEARELLRLRYEEGLEIADIGAAQGSKHSAITMKLYRLREQLRQCIERRLSEVSHG